MVKTQTRYLFDVRGNPQLLWLSGLAGSALIHFGTAILRLNSFFPSPQMIDLAVYYAAAWSTRLNVSPYTVASHNSPPLWAWLLQPITLLPLPSAAMLWLFILLVLVVYCHVVLMHIAGYTNWKLVTLTLPITLTFGPLFLNLTLGQNGIFLLVSALLLGQALKKRSRRLEIFALLMWVVAVGAKIYPILWISCLLPLKRWRTFTIASVLCLTTFGGLALSEPEINADYWFNFLPKQTQMFATGIGIDDQSLSAFLSRIGTSNRYAFPALDVQASQQVTWLLPWNFSDQSIRYFSFVLLFMLGGGIVYAWIQNHQQDPDGVLYSMVLSSLLLFPHMERYNHILALPAMAWLWKQPSPYRNLTIIAYGMFGLSRLTHLWALLPSPIGPFASGFGLFGVLILMLGLAHALVRHKSTLQTDQVG